MCWRDCSIVYETGFHLTMLLWLLWAFPAVCAADDSCTTIADGMALHSHLEQNPQGVYVCMSEELSECVPCCSWRGHCNCLLVHCGNMRNESLCMAVRHKNTRTLRHEWIWTLTAYLSRHTRNITAILCFEQLWSDSSCPRYWYAIWWVELIHSATHSLSHTHRRRTLEKGITNSRRK